MFVLGAAARGAGACAWLAVAGAAMPHSGEGVLGSESLMHEQHSSAMYVKPNKYRREINIDIQTKQHIEQEKQNMNMEIWSNIFC